MGSPIIQRTADTASSMLSHVFNTANPHSVTKAQVGLGNVDNTSDADKPVSTAQATAIELKEAVANKDATGGYAGLTLFKINFKNALNTFTSFFTNSNTASRTYTFPNYDGTMATVAGTETFTNKSLTSPTVTGTVAGTGATWNLGAVSTLGLQCDGDMSIGVGGVANQGTRLILNATSNSANGGFILFHRGASPTYLTGDLASALGSGSGAVDWVYGNYSKYTYINGAKATEVSSTGLSVTGSVSPSQGIAFPATAYASADANTLDDYEEGTWTPTLTCENVGDLSVSYSTQRASYTKIGRQITVHAEISTSAFTHSTALGQVGISGLPFTSSGYFVSAIEYDGFTSAGYTGITSIAATGQSKLYLDKCGSGVGRAAVVATEFASGGTVILVTTCTYFA